jgi:hypothetical protein
VRRILTLTVLAALMLAGAAMAQDKPTFVGNKGCMCHNMAAKGAIPTSWATTKHATALATLEKADAKVTADWAAKLKVKVEGPAAKAPACLKCHVVGHGAGGYGTDPAKDAVFAGVGCESCHGAASVHVKAPAAEKAKSMQPLPGEAVCKTCHTPETSPKFVYAEYAKTGLHAKKPAAK